MKMREEKNIKKRRDKLKIRMVRSHSEETIISSEIIRNRILFKNIQIIIFLILMRLKGFGVLI
jgi:hypothetical protein